MGINEKINVFRRIFSSIIYVIGLIRNNGHKLFYTDSLSCSYYTSQKTWRLKVICALRSTFPPHPCSPLHLSLCFVQRFNDSNDVQIGQDIWQHLYYFFKLSTVKTSVFIVICSKQFFCTGFTFVEIHFVGFFNILAAEGHQRVEKSPRLAMHRYT